MCPDAEKTLAAFRGDSPARAERAERETSACRTELAQLREGTGHYGGTVVGRTRASQRRRPSREARDLLQNPRPPTRAYARVRCVRRWL